MEIVKVTSIGKKEYVEINDYVRGWMDATEMDEVEAEASLMGFGRSGGYFKGLIDGKTYADYWNDLEAASAEYDLFG